MGKVLLVVRVSTEDQTTDSQKEELENYLIGKGLNKADFIYIVESGASAIKLNDKYIKLIDDIKEYCLKGGVSTVAFWSLNRLGRKEGVLISMKEFFVENKIQVYIKDQQLQLLNDDGTENNNTSCYWSILSNFIKTETAELKAKTKRGMQYRKSKGFYIGGTISFGYKVGEDKRVVEDIRESEIIREIRKLYSTGKYSFRTLYEEIKSRGIKLREEEIKGRTIELLVSESYSKFSDDDINNKIKEVKAKNNVYANKTQKGKIHLCSKLLVCPSCGNFLVYNKEQYKCSRYRAKWKTPEKECSFGGSIKADYIDVFIWEFAKKLEIKYSSIVNFAEESELLKEKSIIESKIEVNNNNRLKVMNRKADLKESLLKGLINAKELEKGLSIRANELLHIDSVGEELQSKLEVIEDKLMILKRGGTGVLDLDSLGDKEKYDIIHKNIKRGVYKDKLLVIQDREGKEHKFRYYPRQDVKFVELVD